MESIILDSGDETACSGPLAVRDLHSSSEKHQESKDTICTDCYDSDKRSLNVDVLLKPSCKNCPNVATDDSPAEIMNASFKNEVKNSKVDSSKVAEVNIVHDDSNDESETSCSCEGVSSAETSVSENSVISRVGTAYESSDSLYNSANCDMSTSDTSSSISLARRRVRVNICAGCMAHLRDAGVLQNSEGNSDYSTGETTYNITSSSWSESPESHHTRDSSDSFNSEASFSLTSSRNSSSESLNDTSTASENHTENDSLGESTSDTSISSNSSTSSATALDGKLNILASKSSKLVLELCETADTCLVTLSNIRKKEQQLAKAVNGLSVKIKKLEKRLKYLKKNARNLAKDDAYPELFSGSDRCRRVVQACGDIAELDSSDIIVLDVVDGTHDTMASGQKSVAASINSVDDVDCECLEVPTKD